MRLRSLPCARELSYLDAVQMAFMAKPHQMAVPGARHGVTPARRTISGGCWRCSRSCDSVRMTWCGQVDSGVKGAPRRCWLCGLPSVGMHVRKMNLILKAKLGQMAGKRADPMFRACASLASSGEVGMSLSCTWLYGLLIAMDEMHYDLGVRSVASEHLAAMAQTLRAVMRELDVRQSNICHWGSAAWLGRLALRLDLPWTFTWCLCRWPHGHTPFPIHPGPPEPRLASPMHRPHTIDKPRVWMSKLPTSYTPPKAH